jgi:hypothetical protein
VIAVCAAAMAAGVVAAALRIAPAMPRLILVWVAICGMAMLAGCSPAKVAGALLTGGGPNVAANVQAGKTNAQTIGTTTQVDQRLVRPTARTIEQSAGETSVRTERVETIRVQREAPPWIWFLMIAGWLLPSPGEISRGFRGLVRWGRGNADG